MNNRTELFFLNPVFHDGINLTVRRGEKWMDRSITPYVTIDGIEVELPQVVRRYVRFSNLTDDDLHYEHDPQCRTVEGLEKELKRIYEGFHRDEMVTLLYFNLSYCNTVAIDAKPKVEYTVVVEPTWEISQAVNNLLDEGWEIHGPSMLSHKGNVIQPLLRTNK